MDRPRPSERLAQERAAPTPRPAESHRPDQVRVAPPVDARAAGAERAALACSALTEASRRRRNAWNALRAQAAAHGPWSHEYLVALRAWTDAQTDWVTARAAVGELLGAEPGEIPAD